MKTRLTHALFATLATAALLSGCGTNAAPSLPVAPQAAAGMDAQATKTLLTSFKNIFLASFTKIDANSDGAIDEYEAGPNINLRDFSAADKNHNGKLTKNEFMNYATGGSVFGFLKQDKNAFMRATRNALASSFNHLDKNRDRLLSSSEMSDKSLAKERIYLAIDSLHIRVVLTELDDTAFEASDKTQDKYLGQAEFEDYCMDAFIKGINPNFSPTPNPAPQPEPQPAPADPSDPAAGGDDAWW
jgi:Ca2+-binding EF-hand superfamily protein